jgi:hypothetical protein
MGGLLLILLGVNSIKFLDMAGTTKGIKSLEILVHSTHFKIRRWLINLW